MSFRRQENRKASMRIDQAIEISEMFGGEVVEAEDGCWLVLLERADRRVVVLSQNSVEEYYDRAAFEAGRCYCCISLM
jgi:hypothetical protein